MLENKPKALQFYTFDTFLQSLNLPPKISFEEFRSKLGRKNRKPNKKIADPTKWEVRRMTFDQFVEKIRKRKPDDFRFEARHNLWETKNQFDEAVDALYYLFVADRETTLRYIFTKWLKINHKLNYYVNMDLTKPIMKNDTIQDCDPAITRYGRIIKNYFCKDQLKLNKINTGGNFNIWATVFEPFYDYQFPGIFFTPAMIKVLNKKNYKSLIGTFRGVGSYASTFNPYLCAWILENICHTKKLFTPVLDWGSYTISAINNHVEHHVGVDVVDSMVDFSNACYETFEHNTRHEMYCCPSEKLDERHDFSNKYKDHFDTVFFSPPYFNLEFYDGGEQSIESFNTYEEWLDGYWRKTVELCHRVLQKGGKFTFVISDYKNQEMKWVRISDDMKRIAEEKFKFSKEYKIQHQNQKKARKEKMLEGNFERYIVLEKE